MKRSDFLQRLESRTTTDSPQRDAGRGTYRSAQQSLTSQQRVDLFLARLDELGVEAHLVPSLQCAREDVERLVAQRGWARIACAATLRWPGIAQKWTAEAREAEFGLCDVDRAVAETGSVMVAASPAVRRAYSLVPTAAGFFVSERSIASTIGDVLHELTAADHPPSSCITFISGPSSTADIASIHVVGVHGPREVYVWVISEGPEDPATAEV